MEKNVEAILKCLTARTKSHLRRVLRSSNLYKKYIPSYSKHTATLHDLLMEYNNTWNDICDKAIRK